MNSINLILGTMTFGPQVDEAGSSAMVQRFFDAGHSELDTAYVYNDGDTDRILASILRNAPRDSFRLATKVHPRVTCRLDGHTVERQLAESLERLGLESVDILYFHFPDPATPVEDALETCARLHSEGRFRELGLSNYPAWMVADIWHLCHERGWPSPTVYQGLYNGISRKAEAELFPALRHLGMRFYAFNPLAGGLLTGKHTDFDSAPSPGRFTERGSYRKRYWRESLFTAVRTLVAVCERNQIPPAEAALRWLAHHSCLDATLGDGIILGASKMSHLEQNLPATGKGSLPEDVVTAFDDAWEQAECDSPDYFRLYSP